MYKHDTSLLTPIPATLARALLPIMSLPKVGHENTQINNARDILNERIKECC